MIPETESSEGVAGGLLQQYGGLLGLSNASASQSGAISPSLYPNIVQSLPYQVELMNTRMTFSEYDTTVTIHEYFTKLHSPSIINYIGGYTIGLPGKIVDLFRDDRSVSEELNQFSNRDSIYSISKNQMSTISKMRERISVNLSQETGVLSYSVDFPKPRAAAVVAEAGIELLKESVKKYRTEKARQNLNFVKQQVEEARKRFNKAQTKLAEFRDSNVNMATAKAKTREQELQSEYELTFNLYKSLSERLEQAKISLQEDTPVFTVLQPVSVPLSKSSPKRLLIVIISGLLGLIIALSWILIYNWWLFAKDRLSEI